MSEQPKNWRATNSRTDGRPSQELAGGPHTLTCDDQPDIVFTDRGQGFFNIQTGKITEEYSEALRAHGLQAFMGTDASRQPGDLKEMMLHETAVAWITHRLKVTTPARAWEETPGAFGNRLKGACEYINNRYDVENLCRALPQRVRSLRDKEGGRLSQ